MTLTHEHDTATTTPAAVEEPKRDNAVSRLPLPERETLPNALANQLSQLESQLGYLPNWAAAGALGGEPAYHLNSFLLSLLGTKGTLSYEERDFLALVTSSVNGCSYCRLNHIQSYGRAVDDHALATRIGLDYREVSELDPRKRALAEFAQKVSEDVHSVTDSDYAELRSHGLDDRQIAEALYVVIAFAAGNRLTVALGVLPDQQFFEN